MSPKPRVGFIGAGRMGRPMCGHIMKAGYGVTVYDPVPAAVDAVVKLGGRAAASSAEVAAASDVVLVMPGFYNEVEEAICAAGGILEGAAEGCVVVVASTIKPDQAKDLAQRCAARGVRFIDAPVCQGERGALEAYLVWLVGGPEDVVEEVAPVLRTCGEEIFHLGDVGAGMVGKAMNNMLLWAALVADHEALAIAEKHGVSTDRLIPALLRSSGTNWPLEHWSEMKRIPWAHKDMQIVLEMGDKAGLTLPIAGLLREQVKSVMRAAGISEDLIR
ncbi:2-(hydroxymethyl)glutarate dehydrogenase [Hartmannibacter diazotrophicus]|uniref:2-(Hydroxymethyl)glutarate dehydrogenase n=1 Tax=Hartmannibacter diazotrophicus TaxID=1482074 RepID=A0A2C9D0Y4_9HYPH|nr:NAD(P)-dependent oxidoreductase [Hartmannibacter diazotrophicus]SON53883.1 2-(hydroxymethyl)glutarate dehydrogenase [Hartmannibacter diazotrophicus]